MPDYLKRMAMTGAAGGIGRAIVQALLATGIRVAGVDREHEPLAALATMAREQGKADELLTLQIDLTSDTAADEITRATRSGLAGSTSWSTMPGSAPGRSADSWQRPLKIWEVTPDQWRRFVAVHTTAPLVLTNAVYPR